jgi:hypothetical protein
MASSAQPVRIGPFTGGLNLYSDPSTIGDTECADINNFDIDLDGTLVSRPPLMPLSGPGTNGLRIIGYFTWTDGVVYILASSSTTTYQYNTSTLVWTTITSTFPATSMVQYNNTAYLVSPFASANPGGSWNPTALFVAVSTMPHGVTAVMYKERMWIGSGTGHTSPSRLFFCTPLGGAGTGPGGTWNVADFIDINNGDGQNIIEIISFNGAIIVFKQNSTYMFAYDSQPTKGAVQTLSTIGIVDRDCVVVYEGVMYVMYSGYIYAVTNWNWEQVNIKVPFQYVNTRSGLTRNDYSLSIVGNRLICRYFDTYYIYGLKTKVWSKWTFTSDLDMFPHKFFKYPTADPVTGIAKFYSSSALLIVVTAKGFQTFRDTYTSTESESMNVSVRSKTYNFNVPYSYKRLFWWGVDLLTNSPITARVIPVSYGTPVTWGQLPTLTWNSISTHMWSAPIDNILDVSDSADIRNTSGIRMFVKFLKALRFRQLAFDLSSTVDGTTNTGPLRLFSITAFVANKELSNKKIN